MGDYDEVTADEDMDRDVEIAEGAITPVSDARRRLEERRERFVDDEVFA